MRTRSSPARRLAARTRCSLRLLLCVAGAAAAHAAGLTWLRDTVDAAAGPDQAEVHLEFPFVNRSERTITVKSVKPGCGCTMALLDRKTYAPGESGSVRAIFTVGDRTGLQEKVIAVQTDAPDEDEPKELTMRIKVSAYLAFAPEAVFWNVGDAPVEKAILCTAERANAVTLAAADPEQADFTTRIEAVEPGRRYRLYLRPKSTARPLSATVRLRFEVAGSTPRVFDAFAYVTPGGDDKR